MACWFHTYDTNCCHSGLEHRYFDLFLRRHGLWDRHSDWGSSTSQISKQIATKILQTICFFYTFKESVAFLNYLMPPSMHPFIRMVSVFISPVAQYHLNIINTRPSCVLPGAVKSEAPVRENDTTGVSKTEGNPTGWPPSLIVSTQANQRCSFQCRMRRTDGFCSTGA